MTDGFFSRRARTYEQENAWILSPDFIRPLVPTVFGKGRLLDVCAGTGVISEYAQSIGWEVTALDSNADMLRGVAPPVTPLLGDAHCMPFPDGTFDLVVCRQGIQYLEWEPAIREMLRVSAGQVRLLHGFIRPEYIDLWKHLFAAAGGPNRRFFSDAMLDAVIDSFPHKGVERSFLKSRERFRKPPQACAAIDQILAEHPRFMADHRLENGSECFYYDLNWVTHIITK